MLKNRKLIGIIMVLGLLTVVLSGCSDEGVKVNLDTKTTMQESESLSKTVTVVTKSVYVYVTGAVKKPGVYKMKPEARLYEVIDKAGGFKSKARKDYLNLAEPVNDGQKIYVYSKREYKKLLKNANIGKTIGGSGSADPQNSNQSGGALVNGAGASNGAGSSNDNKKININTATAEEFKTLQGIGDAKAQAIVAYREENGKFASIDDLTKVSGIGEATLAKIKDKLII